MSAAPLPRPTPHSAPFWTACREGRLVAPRCTACGCTFFPPRAACPQCLAAEMDFVESAGAGEIYSFTIIHRAPFPGLETPYVVALISLDEGWRMGAGVIDCDPDTVSVGMRVKVAFRKASDEITLPYFAPATP